VVGPGQCRAQIDAVLPDFGLDELVQVRVRRRGDPSGPHALDGVRPRVVAHRPRRLARLLALFGRGQRHRRLVRLRTRPRERLLDVGTKLGEGVRADAPQRVLDRRQRHRVADRLQRLRVRVARDQNLRSPEQPRDALGVVQPDAVQRRHRPVRVESRRERHPAVLERGPLVGREVGVNPDVVRGNGRGKSVDDTNPDRVVPVATDFELQGRQRERVEVQSLPDCHPVTGGVDRVVAVPAGGRMHVYSIEGTTGYHLGLIEY